MGRDLFGADNAAEQDRRVWSPAKGRKRQKAGMGFIPFGFQRGGWYKEVHHAGKLQMGYLRANEESGNDYKLAGSIYEHNFVVDAMLRGLYHRHELSWTMLHNPSQVRVQHAGTYAHGEQQEI